LPIVVAARYGSVPVRTGPKNNKLQEVHARLFAADVVTLKRVADERGNRWQVELRQLVRRALKGEKNEFLVIKERG